MSLNAGNRFSSRRPFFSNDCVQALSLHAASFTVLRPRAHTLHVFKFICTHHTKNKTHTQKSNQILPPPPAPVKIENGTSTCIQSSGHAIGSRSCSNSSVMRMASREGTPSLEPSSTSSHRTIGASRADDPMTKAKGHALASARGRGRRMTVLMWSRRSGQRSSH